MNRKKSIWANDAVVSLAENDGGIKVGRHKLFRIGKHFKLLEGAGEILRTNSCMSHALKALWQPLL